MMRSRTFGLRAVLFATILFGWSVFQAEALAAESYPGRTIRLIVPYPPGGASDIVGRLLGAKLGEVLGQQIVVDNRGGGAQVIATQLAAKATPDGYTVFLASTTHATNPGLQKKLPYDSIKDFTPITLVAEAPVLFVAHPSLGVSNISELVALAKSRPGRISYASAGPGTPGHLSVELLKWMVGIDLVHVPYKGSGPALVDVVSGQVQVMCTSPLAVLPQVKAGRLRGLAMTTRTRSRAAPEIPTVAESGVPGYHSSGWFALLGPAGLPQSVVDKLHTETVKVLKSRDVAEQLMVQGANPIGNSPQELAAFLKTEIDRWTKVIREANIQPN